MVGKWPSSTRSHTHLSWQPPNRFTGLRSPSRGDVLDRLDELGFAVWWMDDGSMASLSTHAFTVPENEIIVSWLRERWGIVASISVDRRVQKPFLTFRQPNVAMLLRLVAPHVIPSLWYKFGRFLPMLFSEGRLSP